MESQLDAFTKTLAAKDAELLKLREEKATTEIALKAALQEKESVDRALDTLKGDMGKVRPCCCCCRCDGGDGGNVVAVAVVLVPLFILLLF